MSTTYTEELPFDVVSYRSKIDGALVIEIDTSWDSGEEDNGIRINLNDSPIYEGQPDTDDSPFHVLRRIQQNDPIRAAALTEEQWKQTPEYVNAGDWGGPPDETRPVLVMWHDPTETPSQAVARLNTEVMEAHGREYVEAESTLGRVIIAAAANLWSGTEIPDWRANEYVRGQVELIMDTVRLLTPAEYNGGWVDSEELKDRALSLMRAVQL